MTNLLCDDHVNTSLAGQGEITPLQDFVLASLGCVLHGNNHLVAAGNEVHRSTHTLHHLTLDMG